MRKLGLFMRCAIVLGKPTARNGCIRINAAVAEEGPIAAYFIHLFGVAFGNENVFFASGRLRDDAPERISDKGIAPKFEAAFGRAFIAGSIDRGHVDAVGNGVRALHSAPGVELGFTVLRFL